MTITEFIEKLQKAQEAHGDLNILINGVTPNLILCLEPYEHFSIIDCEIAKYDNN